MMSNLAFSYKSLATGGSWELSTSEAAPSGDGADRFSRKPCRGALWSLTALTTVTPFPSCLGPSLQEPR